jgi:hypothetical protein
MEACDIVFGVWHDPDEPDGIGCLLLKGVAVLQEAIKSGALDVSHVAAIPCTNGDHAVALCLRLGEGDLPPASTLQ